MCIRDSPWADHFLRAARPGHGPVHAIVCGADAGHCTGPTKGTMYVLVMVDANAQTVILGWAYLLCRHRGGLDVGKLP